MLSSCTPERSSEFVHRVCHDCIDYFAQEFGHKAAVVVSAKFLEYKFNKGLNNQPIDPRTIPLDDYITSQASLQKEAENARLAETTRARAAEYAREANVGRRRRSSLVQNTVPDLDDTFIEIQEPPPVVHRSRHHDSPQRRHRSQDVDLDNVSSRRKPAQKAIRRKAVHVRSEFSHPAPSEHRPAVPEMMAGCPVVELYTDLEFDYPQTVRGRPLSGPPVQPKPIRPRTKSKEIEQKESTCSLVQRITELAEDLEIEGYTRPKRESVPILYRAPKVPTWRKDTPNPAYRSDTEERRPKRVSFVLPPPVVHEPQICTAPATFVRGKPSVDSLMVETGSVGASVISIPPRKATGVRMPGSAQYYHERGVPSLAYMEEDSQDGDHEDRSQLVSISTPSPSFSCAVQSCFCDPDDPSDKGCPSCLERRRLESKWQMKWI
ncbi:uncharacterized protein F4812DRAFT_408560 [Daldinia caldariorum]|uniref:uncharacterized protein n=1 Tax=Daldinia caldariorum TaxID=326644 RepID=UPI002007C823|nr:uncharacterized protein F4812DRAFT_408560 [Daldinia caldariorum]KAI1472345.1 hypothetical protein F4812DRAFT_408560 [Daldinia caldariorum]